MAETTVKKKNATKSLTLGSGALLLIMVCIRHWDLNVTEDEVSRTIELVIELASLAGVFYGRWRKGDLYVTPAGKYAPLLLLCLVPTFSTGCAMFMPSERFETRKAELATEVADQMNAVSLAAHTVRVLHAQNVINDKSAVELREHLIIAAASLGRAADSINAGELDAAEAERNIYHQSLMHVELMLGQYIDRTKAKEQSNGPGNNRPITEHRKGDSTVNCRRQHESGGPVQAMAFRIGDYRGAVRFADAGGAHGNAVGVGRIGCGTRLAA